MSAMNRGFPGLCLLAALLAGRAAWSFDVEEVRWGFDGRVAVGRFNPLSVLVSNNTASPVDGELRLTKLQGAQSVDATIVEPVFLSPFTSRWVQLYPFVTNDNDDWSLRFGRSTFPLPRPRPGQKQVIALESSNRLERASGAARSFPDELFPPFVTATDALGGVVLDHVPRWEEARRRAFMDWLYLGGTLVLLQQPDGRFPEFIGSMAALNSPAGDATIGAGLVRRVEKVKAEFDRDQLKSVLASLTKDPLELAGKEGEEDEASRRSGPRYDENDATEALGWSRFFSTLREMTNPEHSWLLLHLMFWVYIGTVFPGAYLCGQKWVDYRLVYVAILGSVVVFGFLFAMVGRRGYGESTSVNTVAILRPLADGAVDVTSWSNTFVTSGGDYLIRHDGLGNLYSTCQMSEKVKGEVRNGAEGGFVVDIPPYSSREFAHRGRIEGPVPKVEILKFDANSEAIAALQLKVTGLDKPPQQAYALYRDRVYALRYADGELTLGHSLGSTEGFLKVQGYGGWQQSRPYYYQQNTNSETDLYQQLWQPLILRSQGIATDSDTKAFRLAPGIVRLLLYTDLPGAYLASTPELIGRQGRALYVMNLSP